MRSRFDDTLVSLRFPSSFAAEQYQALRLKIEQLRRERGIRVIAISSPGLGDGKTVTAINLAAAHAESDRVLLVDADLRRPSVGAHLGMENSSAPGLANALSDKRLCLEHVIRHSDAVPFSVVLGGTPSAPVHELLRSSRLEVLLQECLGALLDLRHQEDHALVAGRRRGDELVVVARERQPQDG